MTAIVGLSAEQLEVLRNENESFRVALESWVTDSGPHAWNVWQKGFHQLAREFSDDAEAAPPGDMPSATWSRQMWGEVTEAVYGSDWKKILQRRNA